MKIKQRLVSPLLMWLIVIIGFGISKEFAPAGRILPESVLFLPFIISAAAYWLYFFFGAITIHRRAALSVNEINKIVKTGVYGIVRHPIYSGDIFLAWGIFLLFPTFRVLFDVIWLTLILTIWMNLEEKSLEEKFGNEYKNYKKKVPMAVPKIFR